MGSLEGKIGFHTAVGLAHANAVNPDTLWSFWHRGRKVERAAYLVGALLLVSGLIHLAILTIGGGTACGHGITAEVIVRPPTSACTPGWSTTSGHNDLRLLDDAVIGHAGNTRE